MRDGVELATDVYKPETGGPAWPVVLTRSTYGRGDDNMASKFTEKGYVAVFQDVRGLGDSGGKFDGFRSDGWGPDFFDAADTVKWIKEQPWCNGKIGTAGQSALGIVQTRMAPGVQGLACQFMEAAASDFYTTLSYEGGVFHKSTAEGWLGMFKDKGGLDVLKTWQSHPSKDDYWTWYDCSAKAADVTAPGLHVGGWFDLFLRGTLDAFMSRQHNGGEGAKGTQKLIIKPTAHGDFAGDLPYTLSSNFQEVKISANRNQFMDYYLKGAGDISTMPTVQYYTLGDDKDPSAPGNKWNTADDWPPFTTAGTAFYLTPAGGLVKERLENKNAELSFTYDPKNPFPTKGGNNLVIASGPYDQREVNKDRTDLLTFSTAALAEPLEVTGRVVVRLYVSSDAPDTDFTAKVVDICPDGRELLVMDCIQRVKYRHGFEKAEPLPIGQTGMIEIDLASTSWAFNKGHRIGLQISSSNFPRFEINPNTGDDFPKEGALREAKNTLHMGKLYPAALLLPTKADAADYDYDGISDAEEATLGTNPNVADTDRDDVTDGDEVNIFKTDPKQPEPKQPEAKGPAA